MSDADIHTHAAAQSICAPHQQSRSQLTPTSHSAFAPSAPSSGRRRATTVRVPRAPSEFTTISGRERERMGVRLLLLWAWLVLLPSASSLGGTGGSTVSMGWWIHGHAPASAHKNPPRDHSRRQHGGSGRARPSGADGQAQHHLPGTVRHSSSLVLLPCLGCRLAVCGGRGSSVIESIAG